MDTPRTPEYQPPKLGTSQCRAPSSLSKGGRRRNSGTKRKRTVPETKAAEAINPETINALTAPSADIETAGPSEDGEDRYSKPAGLSHPKRKEIRRYDVRERLQMKGQVLQASNEAEEQLAATIPLPRLTAEQRRLQLPRPKDRRVVPGNMRDSKNQALPIERDTDHPQAWKGVSPTWKGEAVSKSKLRRMKAKSRIIELEQGEREGNDIITDPANPSAQYSSQIITRFHHNNSNPRQTSPIHFLGNPLQTDREDSEKMSNLRGGPPTGRGRNSGRISRTQHSSNDIESSFHNSPNTSTSVTRRPRGFQPSEVNIGKPPEASAALREPVPSIKATGTEAVPSKFSPVNNGPLAKAGNSSVQVTSTEAVPPKPNPVNDELLTKSGENGNSSIQATATEAIHPKPNPVNVEPITKSGENRNSSLQLKNPEETREFKPSFWSKVRSHPGGATPGWDSSEQDLNQPSWKNRDAIVPTYRQAAKRANMENLPPYKFPRKSSENPATTSFNRQMAGIEKGPVQNLRESSISVNAGAMSATRYNSRKDETHPAKDNSPETKNLASEQGITVKVPPSIEVMSTRVPPHLRGPSHLSQSRDVPTEGSKPSKAADEQPESHFTTSVENPKIKDPRAVFKEEDQTGETTIAAGLSYEVPPRLQVGRLHKSRTTEKSKSMTLSSDNRDDNNAQRNVNIDEEVAAGLNAIDNDEELAVALQEEWSGGQEFTQQDQSHGFGTSKPQAHTLQTKKSAGAKDTDRTPDNTSGATKQQESQGEALAPHLRILVTTTTTSTSHPIKEPSNILVEPRSAQQSKLKPTTLVGTRSEGLKNITNTGEVKQVHSGGAIAKNAKSAVKAGKQPARKGNLLHGNADLVNWDGTLAPPLQGEDWADREAFGGSNRDRKSLIEAWREEHASEADVTGGVKIDTKSLEFQTGKGLIGGNGDVLSFIDDSDHKAIPNDDDFTQLHREQSAAAAIEQYKAETASQQNPTKSGKSGESNGKEQPERRDLKRGIREQEEDLNSLYRAHAPKANIYLRPAESGDMRQCTDIYNQWALDTAFTTMLEPVNTAYWIECYNSSRDDKLPFVVAVHTGQKRWNQLKDVRRTNRETIIGFSVATSYGSNASVYKFSVELELYVHREHLRQGVGRTILDRMLGATCQDYKIIECAPLLLSKPHRLCEWIGGGVPIVHTLAVNLLHWAGEDHDNVEWKMKWLSGDRNLFEPVGTLPRIGYKFVKPVNNCLMLRDSGSVLEPR